MTVKLLLVFVIAGLLIVIFSFGIGERIEDQCPKIAPVPPSLTLTP